MTERDNLIEQLTESLQQSIQIREQLQSQGEKLTTEVMQLRKQLNETLEIIKKPEWTRDHESVGNVFQRFQSTSSAQPTRNRKKIIKVVNMLINQIEIPKNTTHEN